MKMILTPSCIATPFFAAFFMACLAGGPARANPITFQFSGTVTQVPVDQVFGDISFGEAFNGTLSFDPTAADQVPADPSIGSYTFNSPFGLTVDIGAHDFEATGSLNIEVVNSFVDQYTVLATDQTGALIMDLFLLDNTGSALGDDRLPPGGPSLASFGERDFHLDDFLDSGEIQVEGEINAPSTQAVPEPPSTILSAPVLLAIFTMAYRNKRGQRAPSSDDSLPKNLRRILLLTGTVYFRKRPTILTCSCWHRECPSPSASHSQGSFT